MNQNHPSAEDAAAVCSVMFAFPDTGNQLPVTHHSEPNGQGVFSPPRSHKRRRCRITRTTGVAIQARIPLAGGTPCRSSGNTLV